MMASVAIDLTGRVTRGVGRGVAGVALMRLTIRVGSGVPASVQPSALRAEPGRE
jgi:hypothetical protein